MCRYCRMFTTAADALNSLDVKPIVKTGPQLSISNNDVTAPSNSQGEALLATDKCGEAIRSLRESKTLYAGAGEMAVEYAKVKGKGTQAKPERHTFFKRLLPILDRTLEKCERENGFIYHQKVPYDPEELEVNSKTHGLVAPESFEIPPVSPLWTPMAYAAFDDSKLGKEEQEKKKSKSERKAEEEVKPVKEIPIEEITLHLLCQ